MTEAELSLQHITQQVALCQSDKDQFILKCGINKKWDKKYASAKEKPEDSRTLKLIDMSSSVSFAFGCSIPLWAGEYILVHNTFCNM